MTRHFDDSTFLNSSWQFCWWPVFGMIKWPFQTLSDLQLRDKKGHGLNHLKIVVQKIPSSVFFFFVFFGSLVPKSKFTQKKLAKFGKKWSLGSLFPSTKMAMVYRCLCICVFSLVHRSNSNMKGHQFKSWTISCSKNVYLGGGFNPFEKYQPKWESSPNRGEN